MPGVRWTHAVRRLAAVTCNAYQDYLPSVLRSVPTCAPLPLPLARLFSRESKYEIRVLRVVACVRKFLYTVTQKMRVYKLKLAKLTKKMAKIRPGAANGRYGRTASAQKKDVQNRCFSMRFYVKKMIFDKNFTNRCF